MYVYACIWLPMSSILPWLQQYMHVYPVHTCIYWHSDGRDVCQYMQVYVCISIKNTCIYIKQYMNVFPTVSGSIFVCISNSISCCIFRARTHGHGAVTVASHSPAPARGLCPFAARSLWQVCRAAAQAQADCHIQSDQVCADELWTAAASGDLYRRALAEVPWQSWLAVVHEVTAEQRRPSDTEMMRSLSNRQPPLRKRSWGFLNQLHTEIQAQKNNAND